MKCKLIFTVITLVLFGCSNDLSRETAKELISKDLKLKFEKEKSTQIKVPYAELEKGVKDGFLKKGESHGKDVYFRTEKGKQYIDLFSSQKDYGIGDVYLRDGNVPLLVKAEFNVESLEVTGITQVSEAPNICKANYSYGYSIHIPEELSSTFNITPKIHKRDGTKQFRLWDDGWRVVEEEN